MICSRRGCAGEAEPDRTRCSSCLAEKLHQESQQWRRRRKAGVCIRCASPEANGRTHCTPCAARHSQQQSVFKRQRRDVAMLPLVPSHETFSDAQRALLRHTPESLLADRQLLLALGDAVAGLPQREQAVIRLTFFRGLSLDAAGARFNITREGARQLQAKALSRLSRLPRSIPIQLAWSGAVGARRIH